MCFFFPDKPRKSTLSQFLELWNGGPTSDLRAQAVADLPGFTEAEILQEQ